MRLSHVPDDLEESGWIDCRFNLPDTDGMLLVVFDPTNNPTVWPARWDSSTGFESNGGWFEVSEVTHWMPLPEAPKSHAWSDGFKAADDDENDYHLKMTDYTHNPHQPTSPYTYPDYHRGAPTLEASDWDDGYHYRQFIHQRGIIRLKITHDFGGKSIVTYL